MTELRKPSPRFGWQGVRPMPANFHVDFSYAWDTQHPNESRRPSTHPDWKHAFNVRIVRIDGDVGGHWNIPAVKQKVWELQSTYGCCNVTSGNANPQQVGMVGVWFTRRPPIHHTGEHASCCQCFK